MRSATLDLPDGVDLDAELSPHAIREVTKLPSETALREAIARGPGRGGVRSHPAGGNGRRTLTLRELGEDLAALPQCHCGAGPALSDAGGCGLRGCGRRGKPKPPKVRERMSAARIALREGRRPLSRVARDVLHCDPAYLSSLHDRGEVEAVTGPAGEILFDDAEVKRIEASYRCKRCGAFALTPSGFCRPCAGAEAQRTRERSPEERSKISQAKTGVPAPKVAEALRRRYDADPELSKTKRDQLAAGKQAEEKWIAEQLERAGGVGTAASSAAIARVYTTPALYQAALRELRGAPARQGAPRAGARYVEVETRNGKVARRVVLDPSALGRWFYRTTGSRDAYRRLSKALSAANGTDYGPPKKLTAAEVAVSKNRSSFQPTTGPASKPAGGGRPPEESQADTQPSSD